MRRDAMDGMPERNDAVATWLKAFRDTYQENTIEWSALDSLLDDYRYQADLGQPLNVGVEWHER
jgi:hypothetical protein